MTTPAAKIDAFLAENEVNARNLAAAYEAASEKWTFCTDILDALDLPRSERIVNTLEDRFDAINARQA